jgi:hypothetical protein
LFVVESAEGFIVDHELCKDTSPGDAQWLGKRVEKLREATGGELKGLVGDRGFASRQLQVSWAVLAHNLWVAAGLPRKQEQEAVPLAA